MCESKLGIKKDTIELFKLVPITEGEVCQDEVAVKIHSPNLSLKSIEELIKMNENYKEQIRSARESMILLTNKLKGLSLPVNSDYDKIQEENERLRIQLKSKEQKFKDLNTEAIQTIQTLKKDFEDFILVHFLSQHRN